RDSEANDATVIPYGFPSLSVVTTVTPLAKCDIASLKCASSIGIARAVYLELPVACCVLPVTPGNRQQSTGHSTYIFLSRMSPPEVRSTTRGPPPLSFPLSVESLCLPRSVTGT